MCLSVYVYIYLAIYHRNLKLFHQYWYWSFKFCSQSLCKSILLFHPCFYYNVGLSLKSEWQQVSFDLLNSLNNLADIKSTMIWMPSFIPLISCLPNFLYQLLWTILRASTTIGFNITYMFMFHCFFNSLLRSMYLFFFSHSFIFTQWWNNKSFKMTSYFLVFN